MADWRYPPKSLGRKVRIMSAEPTDRQTLAVLEVLGWPDDREGSAHVEDDGHEVTPPGHYWEVAQDIVRAVLDPGGDHG